MYQLDQGKRRLLWIGRSRKEAALKSFFDWFGRIRTAGLRFVCSDMWRAYVGVIARIAPGAVHVLDRFHIVSNVNNAIDDVRTAEAKEMARKGFAPVLKKTRWCFLKRRRNLTPKQRDRLRDVLRYSLKTVRAYLLAESLNGLWRYTHAEHARWYLLRWCTRALRSRIEPMKRFARSLRKHAPLVVNYFVARK